MCDAMSFPATVEEFMEKYKIVDREEVYTNGAEMVPIFRMKQWFEHEASQNADTGKTVGDCISRQAAIEMLMNQNVIMDGSEYHNGFNAGVNRAQEVIRNLPPVQSDVPVINVGDMISRQAATTIPVMPKEHRHYQTNNLDDAYEQGWNDLQECIESLPSAQPERRYTVRELSVFRHGISLSLCSKKSAQRWHYDEDTAIEIEFLERLYEKVGENMRGCKDADD